jgi:hypothetical protein
MSYTSSNCSTIGGAYREYGIPRIGQSQMILLADVDRALKLAENSEVELAGWLQFLSADEKSPHRLQFGVGRIFRHVRDIGSCARTYSYFQG